MAAKRTVRRPKRRASKAAVPEFFSTLTARDWKQIRATKKRLMDSRLSDRNEAIMTSKGYVDVDYDGYHGYVSAHRFTLADDFWPRPRKAARKVVRKRTSR